MFRKVLWSHDGCNTDVVGSSRRLPQRGRLLALIGVLMWLVAGCVTTASSVPSGSQDPKTATALPSGSFSAAPLRTLDPGFVGQPAYTWYLRGMSADQRRLYLSYGVGDGCGRAFAGLHVEQTSESVAIAALVGSNSNHDRACATVLVTEDGYVDLEDPLGARPLVHLAGKE